MRRAKWRLLTGGIVVMILITFLVSFFLLIGEREILLQTSLLFIGMPLIALGGPVLRLHASSRKYVSALKPSQRRVQVEFQQNIDTYKVKNGESFFQIAWKDIDRIVETQDFFLIYRNRFDAGFFPKRAFKGTDISTLRDIVRDRLGERAKVSAD